MQLKGEKKSISNALAMATTTLLAGLPIGEITAATTTDSTANASFLNYAEVDRVAVNKFQLQVDKELTDDDTVQVGFIYDTITGATPNGRVYSSQSANDVIPVTTASGFTFSVSGSNEEAAARPWLTQFDDKRIAGALGWTRKWFSIISTTLGGNYSKEDDYTSLGGSARLAAELNKKRTTLTLGGSVSNDTVSPENGIPEGGGMLWCEDSRDFQPDWVGCADEPLTFKPANKISADVLVGISQLLNRRAILQVNYSYGQTNGYLTDPYKLVSVINDEYGQGESGESAIIYEKRPDQRIKNSIFTKFVYVPGQHALHTSYRVFWDDWGIQAHTLDVRFRYEFSPKFYLQPHLRYNIQTEADFFRNTIDSNDPEPEFVSADHRLGNQDTYTGGLKFGVNLSSAHAFSFRSEYIYQHYRSSSIPDMNIVLLQFIYTAKF